MKAIINAELVMRDHLIPEAVLLIQDGKIAGFGEMRTTPIPEDCELIDAQGAYVGPGLVDIHTHTGGNYRLWQDPVPGAKFHLEHGTTTVLVAQRISSLRHADLILVLDDGAVIGMGDHEQLMQTCEEYRIIAQTQMGDGKEAQ